LVEKAAGDSIAKWCGSLTRPDELLRSPVPKMNIIPPKRLSGFLELLAPQAEVVQILVPNM
jgi:hypothetical protein